jgi:two-component system, cell cycle sensor histidine kinase and response regulator CckA
VLAGSLKRIQRINELLRCLPVWLRRYLFAFSQLTLGTASAALLLNAFGTKATLIVSLIGDVVFLGCAWLGYGEGVLAGILITFVIPHLLLPGTPLHPDVGRFGLVLVLSLLVSSISAYKRKAEKALKFAANELESRVQSRTLQLQKNEQQLSEKARLLDLAPVAVLSTDRDDVIRYWSQGAVQMYGWTSQEAVGQTSHQLLRFSVPIEDIVAALAATGVWETELKHSRKDGSEITVTTRWAARTEANGEISGFLQINADVTERRRIEAHLLHSQKLESIGLLAGGVAHDFNNLLTVINGYTEMILDGLAPDSLLRDNLREVLSAGERAAGLTKQLLAFGRKQLLEPKVLNINDVVRDIQKMLRRLISEDITIVARLAQDLDNVTADDGQIQQIIMNLAVNARDAMPRGGTLTLETSNVRFDETFRTAHPEVRATNAIMMAVTDTGTGMSADVKEHLFEPFFTTKPKGAGTGLGLATVYGMVKQTGGWIWVYSEPGQGSTFKLYFPATRAAITQPVSTRKIDLQGTETILVVEDQPEVRTLALTALQRYGYTVLTATSGKDAIEVSNEFRGTIHLLVTDLIMPGISGREVAESLTASRPGLRVIYTSGYTESTISDRGVLAANMEYLTKPFIARTLAQKVRAVLGPFKETTTVPLASDIRPSGAFSID